MNTRFDYNELIDARNRLSTAFNDASIVRQSKHRLRGGAEATSYFDFDIVTNDPQRCADIVRSISAKILEITITRQLDFIAFIEKTGRATVGAVRIAGAISMDVGISSFIIRLGKELPFEKIKVPTKKGTPVSKKLAGLTVALITDHITSGGEIIQAIDAVKAVGGHVSDVIAYTLKPKPADTAIRKLLSKNILIHPVYYMYDLEDGSYRLAQGGTIDHQDEILKNQS